MLADTKFLSSLRKLTTDADLLNAVQQRLFEELMAQETQPPKEDIEHLGGPGDFANWVRSTVRAVHDNAEAVVNQVKDNTINKALRGSSLILLQNHRKAMSRKALLFFGDVFEYLQRGRETKSDSISSTVATDIEHAYATSKKHNEPLVIVTHSFGSMILYDLLTSNRLPDVNVDLWVSAGAQVSLFAEMRLYASSASREDASYGKATLGKPKQVEKWINFYDAADIFSYLMVPVFGDTAVADEPFRHNANIKTAHGDYFAQPAFYKQVLEEIEKVKIAAKN
jgi:hypothetical protein